VQYVYVHCVYGLVGLYPGVEKTLLAVAKVRDQTHWLDVVVEQRRVVGGLNVAVEQRRAVSSLDMMEEQRRAVVSLYMAV
jgi:hypothetical protein